MRTLPEGEMKILKVLVEHEGHPLMRDMLSDLTSYKTSTRNTYLQRLASRELIEENGDGVRAAAVLFEI